MKYNQNEKLKQMDLSTMVIGVDVGSELHYARALTVQLKMTVKTQRQ